MGDGIGADSLAVADLLRKQVATCAAFTRDTYRVVPFATRPFIRVKRRFDLRKQPWPTNSR
jgi:hypothetical protein